ncbi:MAG: polyisoprenoid-binding protein [Emcibacter sp.]|nr:polyisoprenoid-binding protein [Emcibacter sp.]
MGSFFKAVLVFLLLFSPIAAQAEVNMVGKEVYHFDKTHTNILWFFNHIGFSNSMGQFMDYDGQIILDHDNPDQSSVTITIKTTSIMTGHAEFDELLRGVDYFHVDKFPTATFTSTKVTLTDEKKATVDGDFTLLGITRPLTLKVRLNKRGMDIIKNKMRTGFSVRTTIKRSRWGLTHYLPFVGDDVIIRIETEALIVRE